METMLLSEKYWDNAIGIRSFIPYDEVIDVTAEILGAAACGPEAILKANMETRKGTMKTSVRLFVRGLPWLHISVGEGKPDFCAIGLAWRFRMVQARTLKPSYSGIYNEITGFPSSSTFYLGCRF